MGSVKQTWNMLSLPLMTSGEEAEGVRANTRSSKTLAETEMAEPVVTGPTRACMPQSIRLL